MKFYPVNTKFIYIGQPYLFDNNLFFKSNNYCDKVIQFGGWGQELNVDSRTQTIVCFEAIFSKKDIEKVHLRIPKYTDAKITLDVVEDMRPMKIYYDDSNGWFCFGNKEFRGRGYHFATDTIAVIYNNELEAIFIRPRIKSK